MNCGAAVHTRKGGYWLCRNCWEAEQRRKRPDDGPSELELRAIYGDR